MPKDDPNPTIKSPSLADRIAAVAMAIADYRIWDAKMIRRHGPLYYLRLGLPVH